MPAARRFSAALLREPGGLPHLLAGLRQLVCSLLHPRARLLLAGFVEPLLERLELLLQPLRLRFQPGLPCGP